MMSSTWAICFKHFSYCGKGMRENWTLCRTLNAFQSSGNLLWLHGRQMKLIMLYSELDRRWNVEMWSISGSGETGKVGTSKIREELPSCEVWLLSAGSRGDEVWPRDDFGLQYLKSFTMEGFAEYAAMISQVLPCTRKLTRMGAVV